MKKQLIFVTGVMLSVFVFSLPAKSQSTEIEEILVTASLMPLSAIKSGNAVTVITREQLESRGALSLSNILRDVPGFSVSQAGVLGSQTQIRARGSEANHLMVTIDGVEANDPSQGDEFSWGTLTASDIERIEIIRGPQSSLRGSDAVAGVVNIITRRAKNSGFSTFLNAGSRSTNYGGFNVSHRQDNFDIRFGVSHVESDGANIARLGSEKDGYENTTLNFKSGLKVNDRLKVLFSARTSDGMNQFDADNDFDGFVEDQDRESKFENSTMGLQLDYSSPDELWQHKFLISRAENDNTAFADGVKGNVTASIKDQYQFTGSRSFNDGAKTLSFLAEREQEDWMQRGAISWGIYDPNQDRERNTNSLAVEYRADVTAQLTLALSGRHDKNSEFDSAKTFRGELIYRIANNTRIRGAVGTAIKNPTFTERFGFYTNFIGNPNLIPEESASWEIGFDWQIMRGDLNLSITAFDAELDNEIDGFVYDPVTYAYTSGNMVGKSNRNGAEFSVNGNLSDSTTLSGSYTYTDSTDGISVREVRRPRHTGSLNLGWQLSETLRLNTNIQFTGKQTDVYFPPFPEPSEVVELDSHTLINFNLNYQAYENFNMYLKLENTLDEDYEEVFGYQTLGFGASLGLRYQL
jgi:vitamin B12 transporter